MVNNHRLEGFGCQLSASPMLNTGSVGSQHEGGVLPLKDDSPLNISELDSLKKENSELRALLKEAKSLINDLSAGLSRTNRGVAN